LKVKFITLIMPNKLRLILGDQLNPEHSWFKNIDDNVLYLMIEQGSETEYVKHHIQKLLGFFGAMRRFSKNLKNDGHRVLYLKIREENNQKSFTENIKWIIKEHNIQSFEYQEPDEFRLYREFQNLSKSLQIDVHSCSSEHFLTERNDLKGFFEGKKSYILEYFYRDMRKKFNILMNGDQPEGDSWNFDKSNRKKFPKNHHIPKPFTSSNDLSDILNEIEAEGIAHFGEADAKKFIWPLNRKEALEHLNEFCKNRLALFGTYQDAMTDQDWALYHSRLSFALNTKMIGPLEVCEKAIETYRKSDGEISINQIEGFVRQIIGWREYMRGIYWAKMPKYASLNYFDHKMKLPEYYWTGKTKMKCMSHSISQSLDYAYAHHIQRLMITGNFALLAGIDPDELDEWYLGIYIDAIEWVEITNTRGMSQFADGGIVGSKPYVSSASYIHKMSDYCSSCHYDHKKKTGEKACPFNSLYWHFFERNRDKLKNNQRISMMYRTLDRLKNKNELLEQAEHYLESINKL